MKISDSLRHECMPEMIYSICKLAGSKAYAKDEVKRLITLDSDELQIYNKAYRFAVECGFISENADDIVVVNFSKEQLSSFRAFRYAIFMDVFKSGGTIFTALAKWYLSQGTDIFTYKSAQDLAVVIPNDMFSGIEKDYVLGFRFWMATLGLGMFSKSGGSEILVFATNNIILDWLTFENPFKKGKPILAREFFGLLTQSCPVFSDCVSGNDVNVALSMGLRVLHLNGAVELKYTTDSGDIWHLSNSISNPHTNNITEIIVR